MATEITMPQLGESVTEGTITKWLVNPGDYVNKYDPIAEVMTDKVNAEVPSSFAGTILELIAEEDQTVAVGEVICTLEAENNKVSLNSKDSSSSKEIVKEVAEEPSSSEKSMKKRYSPAVLKLAQEHDIDLERVNGSGRGGRITRKDLLALVENGETSSKEETPQALASNARETRADQMSIASSSKGTSKEPMENSEYDRFERIPVSGVRKAIAQNMVKSKHEAPHAWMMIEVDVTELVKYREKIKNEFQNREGFKLTFLPFFMKAVIDALKAFPQVNAKWDGDNIIRYKDVHLSMAVATENELFVPVIKHADEKNVKGLAKALNDLSRKVRSSSLTQADMQGGTFTLNNTGSFGSIQSQPIINTPQAAILSVESIVKRPVVLENDAIAVRNMVNLCLSLDHRVLDGLVCGKFMAHIKQSLEQMNENTLSIY
ncbi:2-oxo acid dehydrogenase subunit E2 [Salipaludibacillus agaradhaerens]|uniref:dihydrolipoamide acetyltransferase family protein n=1 Tax=Salipaludibacillus agaradhaerens TaxID=76935 RepID=UPI0021513E9E|nr:dihydrolipoamide acetyltransferase family protein [Salipaludibacillus agaradhaerens]MCR6106449.1 2-oxo acid dehydrogenase subunit E2 [Salipaludibacillus agaradhaerens]MCR6118482.1 2-oxo acid dehydrogenase subunit E2 [Salipaludibacillus agaradhaerens]UJW57583.1 2-oxo acid dehydrogenase subunit E2 [Bacillus sp. A116_S68]